MPRERESKLKNRIPLILKEKSKELEKQELARLKRKLRAVVGKSHMTGYNIINGLYSIDLDKYEAIAKLLNCAISDLLPEQCKLEEILTEKKLTA